MDIWIKFHAARQRREVLIRESLEYQEAIEIIERARKLGYQVKLIRPNVIQEGSLTREYPAIIL